MFLYSPMFLFSLFLAWLLDGALQQTIWESGTIPPPPGRLSSMRVFWRNHRRLFPVLIWVDRASSVEVWMVDFPLSWILMS